MLVSSDGRAKACQLCGHESLRKFVVPNQTILWRCSRCGLYQYGPHARGVWRNVSADESSWKPPSAGPGLPRWYTEKHRRRKIRTATVRLNCIAPLLDARRVRMLDIGCGYYGALMEAAGQRGWKAAGTDVTEAAVTNCRELGYESEVCRNGRLPYEDESFDLATAWNVIEHVADVMESLVEWRRVLRPRGILAMTTDNANYLKARILGARYRCFWPRGHTYTFTPDSLQQFLERSGFEVVRQPFVGRLGDLPFPTACHAFAYRTQYVLRSSLGMHKPFQVFARRVDHPNERAEPRPLAKSA